VEVKLLIAINNLPDVFGRLWGFFNSAHNSGLQQSQRKKPRFSIAREAKRRLLLPQDGNFSHFSHSLNFNYSS